MNNLTYGIHSVKNLIKTNKANKVVFLIKENINNQVKEILALAKSKNIEVKAINNISELGKNNFKNTVHQGIFAYEKETQQKLYSEKDIDSLVPKDRNAFILILDNIQDPHNFGACIRTAHSSGVDFIVVPKDNSSPVNATVKKVACGAVEHTKIVIVTNLARAIEKLQKLGVWIIGLAGEVNETLYDMNLKDSIALVAGSEGKGMRQKTKAKCDFLVQIPMYGKVSSLNVSVASGISMYEVVRQRL